MQEKYTPLLQDIQAQRVKKAIPIECGTWMKHEFMKNSGTAPEGDGNTYKAFGSSVAG